ncbi:MAG: hypothetical protein Q7V05_17150 [Methanoregula sp.]|nr:hypothetical protein [Methanoregula sp.]
MVIAIFAAMNKERIKSGNERDHTHLRKVEAHVEGKCGSKEPIRNAFFFFTAMKTAPAAMMTSIRIESI